MTNFANPAVFTQGWYPAMRATELREGRALTRELLGRKMTFFRTSGRAYALDARCPHMGADLGLGDVSGEGVRCAFHGWVFDGNGLCAAHPAVRAVSYPVEERYGFLWIFNGPSALFALPQISGRAVRLPSQTMNAHPHVIAGNGFDTAHFSRLHDIVFHDQPRLEQIDRFHTSLQMRLRFNRRTVADAVLRSIGGADVTATFMTHGANLATIDGSVGRTAVRVLFSHTPLPDGRSRSRTTVFIESAVSLPLVLMTLVRIVSGDRHLLDHVDFQPNLAESDWAFAAFMRQVEAMPLFPDAPRAARLASDSRQTSARTAPRA